MTQPNDALRVIRLGSAYELDDALELFGGVCDYDSKGYYGEDGHWKRAAQRLGAGVALHVLHCPDYRKKTLDACLTFLAQPAQSVAESMVNSGRMVSEAPPPWTLQRTEIYPAVIRAGREHRARPYYEAEGVQSTLVFALKRYRNRPSSSSSSSSASEMLIAVIIGRLKGLLYYIINRRRSYNA